MDEKNIILVHWFSKFFIMWNHIGMPVLEVLKCKLNFILINLGYADPDQPFICKVSSVFKKCITKSFLVHTNGYGWFLNFYPVRLLTAHSDLGKSGPGTDFYQIKCSCISGTCCLQPLSSCLYFKNKYKEHCKRLGSLLLLLPPVSQITVLCRELLALLL